MQKISGIYRIQSLSHPERCYIGSAVNIHRRWFEHLTSLKRNKHYSSKLQRHYNKYGRNDLQFSIIIGCEKTDLVTTEQFFIDSYKPFFNSNPTAGSPLGRKLSDETKDKIRQNKLGVPLTDYHKQRCREGQLTGNHPIRTKEWNENIAKGNRGKKRTLETRKLQSDLKKGKPTWNKGLKTGKGQKEFRLKTNEICQN
jgi:group I intron endonuclease